MNTRARARTIIAITLAVIAVAAVIVVVAFYASGGRWFIILTPSMGQAAPVGTLVLTAPASHLHVGDIISFRPPTSPGEVYTHRIHQITTGGITTKGDVNGAVDPWTLATADIIGRATVILPGFGWLIQAIPLLLVGITLVWLISGRFSPTTRTTTRLIGVPLVVAAVTAILRPLIGVVVETSTTAADGAHAAIVSTGILPTTVTANGAQPIHLGYGQLGTIHSHAIAADGYYRLVALPDFTTGQLALVLAICAIPTIVAVTIAVRRRKAAHE